MRPPPCRLTRAAGDTLTTESFSALGLDERLIEALDALGFTAPTPIQAAAVPAVISGSDVVGRARTGSGKTAAFGLGVLQRLLTSEGKGVRALVLAPTRELAPASVVGNTGLPQAAAVAAVGDSHTPKPLGP